MERNIAFTAYNLDTTERELGKLLDQIVDEIKGETGIEIDRTKVSNDFIGAYFCCNESLRKSLVTSFAEKVRSSQSTWR